MTDVTNDPRWSASLQMLHELLRKFRAIVPGSLSVKTRTGIDDERQIFDVLHAFADAGIDFLVVHSRTVAQKYRGHANHELTTEIVDAIDLPVIANGDVRSVDDAQAVLSQTGAAGLMLGRGALADPHLFGRIRGTAPATPTSAQRKAELAALWRDLLDDYVDIFAGDAQVLSKFSSLTRHVDDPDLKRWLKGLKKARRVTQLREALDR